MLTNLHISNIVLIDKLNLEFGRGLNVLTGETGAGKSILLDALALALGARSDAGLIRHGCESAQVIAEFQLPAINPQLSALLEEQGIEFENMVALRRTLSSDGKSKAWVNDVPVSVKTLKTIGDELCEIHGQFENHSLLDPATHIAALDEFGGYDLTPVRNAYAELHASEKKLKELQELLERSAVERDFLEHNVKELIALNPQPGEEEQLAASRAALMDAEKNAAILAEAAANLNQKGQGLDGQVFAVAHILERIKTAPNPYQPQIDRLYEIAEKLGEISAAVAPHDTDTASLENIEARLFAIRASARKHRVAADELPAKLQQMSQQLNAIDNHDAELEKTKKDLAQKKSAFDGFAKKLTAARTAAAASLRDAILAELPDLKLKQADFMVQIDPCAPAALGADTVIFLITTNPGTPFAPLHKIASGGEVARLMLALRVVLTRPSKPDQSPEARSAKGEGRSGVRGTETKTFVFDEVDTGISGATASAVGARLARLAKGGQALVITHSAQVAGYGDTHFLIQKNATSNTTTTSVSKLSGEARTKEVARIISGAKITSESIASAKTLIKN
ncbi:MAG: DNA repair protein RecN [Alphaproteobacteria bacterium]|nr:DNA repair protein RecN [Alphaproteobacteria bacterium]